MTGALGVGADEGTILVLFMIPDDAPVVLGGAATAGGDATDDPRPVCGELLNPGREHFSSAIL